MERIDISNRDTDVERLKNIIQIFFREKVEYIVCNQRRLGKRQVVCNEYVGEIP